MSGVFEQIVSEEIVNDKKAVIIFPLFDGLLYLLFFQSVEVNFHGEHEFNRFLIYKAFAGLNLQGQGQVMEYWVRIYPRVPENVLRLDAFKWVDRQHLLYEIDQRSRKLIRNLILAALNFVHCLFVSLSLLERTVSSYHVKENNSQTPNVYPRAFVRNLFQDLGGHEVYTPTVSIHIDSIKHFLGKSEVGYFNTSVFVDQNVGWLEVPVSYSVGVAMVYSSEDLFEDVERVGLLDRALFDEGHQFQGNELEYEEDIRVSIEDVIEPDYVRMSQLFQNIYLSPH